MKKLKNAKLIDLGRSIKNNFILNLLNTFVGLLFPLVTFPYVARILDPDGIGVVQFYQSIINYIVLFSSLGIPMYAVREVARCRENIHERNRITLEILILHFMLSLLGYVAVAFLCLFVPQIRSHYIIFLILSASIGFTVIGVSWFFQGVEDFKYITVRSLITRFLTAVALFTFIRTKNDVWVYALILVLADVGSNIFNIIHLRKYIKVTDYAGKVKLVYRRHFRPAFRIFVLNLSISLYVNLDSVLLGFLSTNDNVGYYTAVAKLVRAAEAITVALGNVLLPRLSNLQAAGDMAEFKRIESKALDYVVMLVLPMTVGLVAIAPVVIPVFSGIEFLPAVPTMEIFALSVPFSGFNLIVGLHILYTQGKETLFTWATVGGGVMNLILNVILIPEFAQNGAAAASVISEAIVMVITLWFGRAYIHYKFLSRSNLALLIAALVMGFSLKFVFFGSSMSDYVKLSLEIVAGVAVYVGVLMAGKSRVMRSFVTDILSMIHRKR